MTVKLKHNFLLLERVVEKTTDSGFYVGENGAPQATKFIVRALNEDCADIVCVEGDTILLKPGAYDGIEFEGESFTVATTEDVLGVILEGSKK